MLKAWANPAEKDVDLYIKRLERMRPQDCANFAFVVYLYAKNRLKADPKNRFKNLSKTPDHFKDEVHKNAFVDLQTYAEMRNWWEIPYNKSFELFQMVKKARSMYRTFFYHRFDDILSTHTSIDLAVAHLFKYNISI